MSNYGNNQGQQGGQRGNGNGRQSHAEIEFIANIASIKDENGGSERVGVTVREVNGRKVAMANIAVNQPNKEEADFWRIEAFASDDETKGLFAYMVNYISIGRKVFIKGRPFLNKDGQGKFWPSIRLSAIEGLDSPNQQGGGQQQGRQGGQGGGYPQQGGQQGAFPPQGGQGGGYPPQGGQQGAFPPQGGQPGGYPPQGGQGGYPPQGGQGGGYPGQGAPAYQPPFPGQGR